MTKREDIAQRFGLPAVLGERLRGHSPRELENDAETLARVLGVEPEPEHVQLARRALRLLQSKAERDRAIVELLHPPTSEGEQ